MKELTLEITNNCSLNCIHCSTQANSRNNEYFSMDEIKHYLDMFPDFNVVRLSGGEPFNHPNLVEICELIKANNRNIVILSSGVQHNKPLDESKLIQLKGTIDEIVFSMHGYFNIHDKIMGGNPRYESEWDTLLDSLDNVSYNKIPFSFQTVLMRHNFFPQENNIPQPLIETAKSLYLIAKLNDKDINWHMLRYVKQGRGKINEDQALTEIELNNLQEIIQFLQNNDNFIQPEGILSMRRLIYSTRHKLNITYTNSFKKSGCDCGYAKAVVTANREIIPCSSLKNSTVEEQIKYGCKYRL
ncbi:radical SAM protein [Candidatus Woesearchaeota archaeon]|nr:radical SAM protein [Candidatus Woesearchaeota archaeon]